MKTLHKGGPASETLSDLARPAARWARDVLDKGVALRDGLMDKMEATLLPESVDNLRTIIGTACLATGGTLGYFAVAAVMPVSVSADTAQALQYTVATIGALGVSRAVLPNVLLSHATDSVIHGVGSVVEKARSRITGHASAPRR